MRTAIHGARTSSNSNFFACLSILLAIGAGSAASGCSGDAGPAGQAGVRGGDGTNGTDGIDGMKGTDGTNGTSGTVDPNLAPIDKAFVAIGGKDAITKLVSYSYKSKGSRTADGEGFVPGQSFTTNTFDLTVQADLATDNLRIDNMRTTYIFGPVPQMITEYLKGDLGYIDGNESLFGIPSGNMVSARWASTRKQQRILNPHLILQAVAADGTLASDGGVALLDGSIHHLVVIKDTVSPITLYVNAQTGRLAKAAFIENDYLYRDREVQAHYIGWEPSKSGLLFPKQVAISLGEVVVHNEVRDTIDANVAIDPKVFDFPAGAAPVHDAADEHRGELSHQFHQIWSGVGIPLDALQSFVMPTQLAPGVFHLTGGSHNSLVVEQANSVVVADAPLYEDRSEAILTWIKGQFPNKPVSHVIITHHHQDHSAGARTFVANGAEVVVGAETAEFFGHIFQAPSTIRPDALAMNPTKAVIDPVPAGGSFAIPDATNPVTAYHVNSMHAADMVIVYVGNAAKVVFVSDIYNPALGPNQPFISEVNDAINVDNNLSVAMFAGGHGGTSTYAEFQALLP